MRKNVAGQVIAAQLVAATDGSAVTSGTTTVYVLGDGGTQSSGGGTVTHEGQGTWSYTPTQAETNYDHVAFTFTNASAISACVQVYPSFPQTGDSFARLGAPAGASIAADIATLDDFVDTEVAAIKAKTDLIPAGGFPTNFSSLAIDGSGNVTLSATEETAIADAILARDLGSGTGAGTLNERTVRSALRFIRNRWDVAAGTLTVRKEDDTAAAWTAAVTGTAGADPITEINPT